MVEGPALGKVDKTEVRLKYQDREKRLNRERRSSHGEVHTKGLFSKKRGGLVEKVGSF